MEKRIEKTVATFNALDKDNMHVLDDFYHDAVVFEDPLGHIEGLPALKDYYARMYGNVQTIRFDFARHIVDGETHVAIWTMRMSAKGLNRGNEVAVDGVSVLRFDEDDLVVYHRDYFDVGAMVYEHVPVLGFITRRVKRHLQDH